MTKHIGYTDTLEISSSVEAILPKVLSSSLRQKLTSLALESFNKMNWTLIKFESNAFPEETQLLARAILGSPSTEYLMPQQVFLNQSKAFISNYRLMLSHLELFAQLDEPTILELAIYIKNELEISRRTPDSSKQNSRIEIAQQIQKLILEFARNLDGTSVFFETDPIELKFVATLEHTLQLCEEYTAGNNRIEVSTPGGTMHSPQLLLSLIERIKNSIRLADVNQQRPGKQKRGIHEIVPNTFRSDKKIGIDYFEPTPTRILTNALNAHGFFTTEDAIRTKISRAKKQLARK